MRAAKAEMRQGSVGFGTNVAVLRKPLEMLISDVRNDPSCVAVYVVNPIAVLMTSDPQKLPRASVSKLPL